MLRSGNRQTDSEPVFPQGIRKKTKRETLPPNLLQIPASIGVVFAPWTAEQTTMMDRALTLALAVAVVANTLCLWSYM